MSLALKLSPIGWQASTSKFKFINSIPSPDIRMQGVSESVRPASKIFRSLPMSVCELSTFSLLTKCQWRKGLQGIQVCLIWERWKGKVLWWQCSIVELAMEERDSRRPPPRTQVSGQGAKKTVTKGFKALTKEPRRPSQRVPRPWPRRQEDLHQGI